MLVKLSKRGSLRGLTLTEIMVASTIFLLMSIGLATTFILFATQEKAIRREQRVQGDITKFLQLAQFEAQRSNNIVIVNDGQIDMAQADRIVRIQQFDDDGDPLTIRDNRIILSEVVAGNLVRDVRILSFTSPEGNDPIFSQVPGATGACIQMLCRVGDQTDPPSAENDALTGKGFQSFLLRIALTPN